MVDVPEEKADVVRLARARVARAGGLSSHFRLSSLPHRIKTSGGTGTLTGPEPEFFWTSIV